MTVPLVHRSRLHTGSGVVPLEATVVIHCNTNCRGWTSLTHPRTSGVFTRPRLPVRLSYLLYGLNCAEIMEVSLAADILGKVIIASKSKKLILEVTSLKNTT